MRVPSGDDEWSVERRHPLIKLGLSDVERLLVPLDLKSPPVEASVLRGGHVNTNYVVTLACGDRLVLRLCQRGEEVFRKEVAMLRSMGPSVPVPEVLGACDDPSVFEFPFLATSWVDGTSLSEAPSSPEDLRVIGAAIAKVLSAITGHSADEQPMPPLTELIAQHLGVGGARIHLGGEMSARILSFVRSHAGFVEAIERPNGVVHGDFQGDNILLQKRDGWRVAAILDWEWAHHGSYLQDLGSLLRFDRASAPGLRVGLERGYAELGSPLPTDWVKAARIWDIAAQCEKLAFPRHRGEVTRRAMSIIDRCLVDYGG